MSYKQSVLYSNPTGFWMLDSLTSSEPSLSIGSLPAFLSVSDRTMMPIASGGDRSFTFGNSSDYVRYSQMNMWSHGNSAKPFSVEFVVHPYETSLPVKVFGPIDSFGSIPDNKIEIYRNKLSFVISDATSASGYTKRYEAYTYFDLPGSTYHCVAVYQPGAIMLYVNGNLESVTSVDRGFEWNNYETEANPYETSGGQSSSVAISALATYKSSLTEPEIKKHHRALLVGPSLVDITRTHKGNPFRINDSDREKMFYMNEPALGKWEEAILDNVSIVKNRITLKKIDPPVLNTGNPSFSSTSTGLLLNSTQNFIIEDAQEYFSGNKGSVGLFFRWEAARHNTLLLGEMGLLSIFNYDKSCRIEVVALYDEFDSASVPGLYLRYYSGNTLISQIRIASPGSTSGTHYLYVYFDQDQIGALYNTASSVVTIDPLSVPGTSGINFSAGATVMIGSIGQVSEVGGWGALVRSVNLFKDKKDLAKISDFKNAVETYTLKLSNSMNVSQSGSAEWNIDTGLLSGQTVVQSRLWWAPTLPSESLKIETGIGSLESVTPSGQPVGINTTVYGESYTDLYGSSGVALGVAENMVPIAGISSGSPAPQIIILKATLTTDDSVNDIVFLKKIGIDLFSNSNILSEKGSDEMVTQNSPIIFPSTENISFQDFYSGMKIEKAESAVRLQSKFPLNPATSNPSGPEFFSSTPTTDMGRALTLEFCARLDLSTSGVVFKFRGVDEHSLTFNATTRRLTVNGFDSIYIDGVRAPFTSGTSTDPISTTIGADWHMFHLVKNDLINQKDDTVYSAVLGNPIVALDDSKFYSGIKSLKITSVTTSDWLSLFSTTSALNMASGAKNTLSMFVRPDATVTTFKTDFVHNGVSNIVTHSPLVAERWNLVTRTFTNPSLATTLATRMGPPNTLSRSVWVDSISLVKGSDAFIRVEDGPQNSSWFGFDVDDIGTNQCKFGLQNVVLYEKTLTQSEILTIYKQTIGNYYVPMNTVSQNRSPASGAMVAEPSSIRNPIDGVNDVGGFDTNPLFLSSAWEIMTFN